MHVDAKAGRKATNLSINKDLLQRARAHGLNLSRLLEEKLIEVLRNLEREAWVAENREAIEEYNRRAQGRGVFSDGLRRF